MLRGFALVLTAVVAAAAAFELALALGASGVGPQPGDGAAGDSIVGPVVFFSLLAGIVVAAIGARMREWSVSLLAPAAGLFVAATDYTYDPYYAPERRRFVENGTVPAAWIFGLLAVSVVVAWLGRRWPRDAGAATAVLLPVWLVTLIGAVDGH